MFLKTAEKRPYFASQNYLKSEVIWLSQEEAINDFVKFHAMFKTT